MLLIKKNGDKVALSLEEYPAYLEFQNRARLARQHPDLCTHHII